MKKILYFCAFLLGILSVEAQEGIVSENIQVGVEVPDFDLQVLTNEGVASSNIRNYRGKVIILEFWATYCGPCLPAMDHLAEVRSNFTDEVEIFAITDEPRSKVVSFLNKRPTSLLISLDNDRILNKLFYHQFMPHTVVIGTDGIVKAITSPDQITKELIYLAKSGAELTVKTKAEFASSNINDTALMPYSLEDNSIYKVIISPKVPGIQSQINKKASNEYEFVNCTIPMMYQALYQTTFENANERPCLEVTQQTKHLLQEDNQYCLKLKVPEMQENEIGKIGMRHLEEIFAIKPQNETRIRNVYALIMNKPDPLAATHSIADLTDEKVSIKDFISLLWETRLVDKPIVNDSGLPDDTLISVSMPTQVYEVKESLAQIGMQLEPKAKEISCLILYKNNMQRDVSSEEPMSLE